MPRPLHTPRVNNNDDAVRVTRILVKPGDSMKAGDLVAEVETEKASFTVESDEPGFVLAVLPRVNDVVAVGSVLLWLGASPKETVPAAPPAPRSELAAAQVTVKAAQLMARYGLNATEVPTTSPRLGVTDVEDYIRAKQLVPVGPRPNDATAVPAVRGMAQPLTPEERGMLRTVLWQRQQAVPGYIEVQYDAAAWERAAAAYQEQERLLLNPLLSLMAYRLVRVALEQPRCNSTVINEQRYVYDIVNLGVTIQTQTTLYLAVIENAGALECKAFIERLGQLQRNAMAHRLRPHEMSGATIAFSSMARWDVPRHIPVLPPFTSLIVAHAAGVRDGSGTLGATYDHRTLTGYDALSALKSLSQPEALS
jgi:pyruvate dehydrogenase E2 component (dihydrolipoamide acetyltransferase)